MEWSGSPVFTVGLSPKDKELLQLRSDRMCLSVPEYVLPSLLSIVPDIPKLFFFSLAKFDPSSEPADQSEKLDPFGNPHLSNRNGRGKVVAKFESGIQMGLGFIFERQASYPPSLDNTDLFEFKPHYQVALRGPTATSVSSYGDEETFWLTPF